MKKAIRFSLVLCLMSWALVAVAVWGFGLDKEHAPMGFMAFAAGYMFLPLIVSLLLQAVDKERFNKTGLVNFKLGWPWLLAWLLPVAMALLCIPVNGLIPGVELRFGAEQLISQYHVPEEQQDLVRQQMSAMPVSVMLMSNIVLALIAGVSINAVAAFGEEYGWRCYLVDALREKKFWTAALFIGFVWGIWHFPLIMMGHNYPNQPYWGVLMMVVFCILFGIVELYFLLKTKSVVVAAIIHGTLNAIGGVVINFVQGGNDITNGMCGLAGFVVIGMVVVALVLFDKYVSKEGIFSRTLGASLEREL